MAEKEDPEAMLAATSGVPAGLLRQAADELTFHREGGVGGKPLIERLNRRTTKSRRIWQTAAVACFSAWRDMWSRAAQSADNELQPVNYFPKLDMHPLAAFDNAWCRRRGHADPDHMALRLVLGRWFAGAADRPSAGELHRWFSADKRSERELAWCADVLVSASADPWFGLRSLVREEALSIYDLAEVCMEAGCRHKPFVEWLNQFADPALCGPTGRYDPPAWAIEGMALTEHGYYAPHDQRGPHPA